MSSSDIAALKYPFQTATIYIGWFSFVFGLLGNTLNIVIFMTLKTFRQTSCAFYLTAASITNIVQLLSSLLARILISGYDIDLTKTSVFLCKIRWFITFIATLTWLTYICLAVADQFASITNRWRHLSNRRLAHRLVLAVTVFWGLHGITALLFYSIYVSPATGQPICTIINTYFAIYFSRFALPVLLGCLPLCIQVVFGILIWLNLHSAASRRAPIARLRRDKQLTSMVLIEFIVDIVLRMPYIAYSVYLSSVTFSDPIGSTRAELISSMTAVCYYSSSTASFIIYCSASSRFRKQLMHVLFHIHLKQLHEKENRPMTNQVSPQSMAMEQVRSIVKNERALQS